MADYQNYLGYIKYDGPLVEEGLMDARRQAQALIGFDSALRYFIEKQIPDFRDLDFEIPVRVRKGSWEALIPETIGGWIQAGLGVVATAYFAKAAQRMAENDFADAGVIEIFKKAIEGIQWFAKIGQHMGDLAIRQFENVEFIEDGRLIGIYNSEGEIMYVPKEILDLYAETNSRLLEKLANNIEEGRDLRIGSVTDGKVEEVAISKTDKHIFCDDIEDLDDVLFPELIHGDNVVLDGEVTRENKTTNSMGFKFEGHILTAYPEIGSIVQYKPFLFIKCRIFGTVNRIDEKGRIGAKRPKLLFR